MGTWIRMDKKRRNERSPRPLNYYSFDAERRKWRREGRSRQTRRIGKRRKEGTQEMNEKEVDKFKLYKNVFQFLVIFCFILEPI